MLIVPDIHGREFWRDPLKSFPDEEVICLGDYLDPYPDENITKEHALVIFEEILEEKRKNPGRITLLLGNHDLMYINPIHKENSCRHDWERDSEISGLFKENIEFFSLATTRGNFVFSHSGIHPSWLSRHPEFGDDIKSSVEILNSKLWEHSTMVALSEFSSYRGGWRFCVGSPVWSDVREWINPEYGKPRTEITQIFGHTQLVDGKIIEDPGKRYICVDCKHVCRLNEDKLEIL